MTTRKHNDFLDLEPSDDEGSDRGYDSEAGEELKGKSKTQPQSSDRASKRRKVSVNDADESDGQQSGDEEEEMSGDLFPSGRKGTEDDEEEEQDNDATADMPTESTKPLTKKPPKKNKTGVIYFSSLPPYLKPSALKSLLTQRGFGPITKVFLSPYVPPSGSSAKKRSNKRRTYTDGWVEFASKRTAKICAETLNATIVGGKKGGWYHDDVLNIKYLRGFKWTDLMEQVQRERSEREARRRMEDARARREEKAFLEGLQKGKVVEGIKKKKEERKRAAGAERENGENADVDVRRVFRQNAVKEGGKAQKEVLGSDAKRILGKIF